MPLSARGGSTETPQARDGLSVEGGKINGRSQSEAVIKLSSAVFTLKVIICGFSSAHTLFSRSVVVEAASSITVYQFVY